MKMTPAAGSALAGIRESRGGAAMSRLFSPGTEKGLNGQKP